MDDADKGAVTIRTARAVTMVADGSARLIEITEEHVKSMARPDCDKRICAEVGKPSARRGYRSWDDGADVRLQTFSDTASSIPYKRCERHHV